MGPNQHIFPIISKLRQCVWPCQYLSLYPYPNNKERKTFFIGMFDKMESNLAIRNLL